MGASAPTEVKAIKYFNEIEIVKEDKTVVNDNLKEKIKLEFFLKNCNNGILYSINALFLENENNNFKSEEKKAMDTEIKFENFYICDYFFETEQKMQIIIYRDETPLTIMTTLGKIIGSRHSEFNKQIDNKELLIIKAVKLGTDKSYVNININIKSDDKDYFKKNKYIFKINCNNQKIYSSESINNEGFFNQVIVPCFLLNPEYTIEFYECKDNKLKGNFSVSLNQLRCKSKTNNLTFKIPISKNIFLSVYDNSQLNENISFFDLISSGVRLKLSIGIDFTGSNGHPLDKDTLHCIIGNEPNDYEKVIKLVGNILSNYNNEKLYPVYGFGAILENSFCNQASMCFNVNFQENPEIYTIDNVIKVYRQSLEKLTFSGPTYFSPIINKVIDDIKLKNEEYKLEYNILMILTDGVIDDMQNTIDALVKGSFEPLSVVIVGIGKTDFSNMVILDGNDERLVSRNNIKATRDLVQFIQYDKYKNNENILTKEILEEIPRQIIEFYILNNYNPDKIREIARQNSFRNNNNNNNNNYNNNFHHIKISIFKEIAKIIDNLSLVRIKGNFRTFYDLEKKIEKKGYLTTYRAKDKLTGEKRTIQILDKKEIISKEPSSNEIIKYYIKDLFKKISYMKIMEGDNNENHNIIKYYEYFHTKDEFVIVSEFYDITLLDFFEKNKLKIKEYDIYNIFSQLNNTFKIMEKYKIVHNSLKLENIFLVSGDKEIENNKFKLRITDDSCSLINISNNFKNEDIHRKIRILAPEILKGDRYNEKADLWSLGVLLYALSHKKYPYDGNNKEEILNNINNIEYEKAECSDLDDLI